MFPPIAYFPPYAKNCIILAIQLYIYIAIFIKSFHFTCSPYLVLFLSYMCVPSDSSFSIPLSRRSVFKHRSVFIIPIWPGRIVKATCDRIIKRKSSHNASLRSKREDNKGRLRLVMRSYFCSPRILYHIFY